METNFVVFAEENSDENVVYGIVGFDRGYGTLKELLSSLLDYLRSEEDFDSEAIIDFEFDCRDFVRIPLPLNNKEHYRERPLNKVERTRFFTEIKFLS